MVQIEKINTKMINKNNHSKITLITNDLIVSVKGSDYQIGE